MIEYNFLKGTHLRAAAEVMQLEYITNPDFNHAVRASVLSAIRDIKGSCSDEKLSKIIADRVFGLEMNENESRIKTFR